MTISNYAELAILNAAFNNTSFVVAQAYVKLHLGDPGEDGTGNPAVETTRKSVSFGAAASGAVTSDAACTWTTVAATETYSHISLWDTVGPGGGNCLWTGPMAAPKAVTAGDTFEFPSASIVVSLD
ncbi:MAG TPA: hypothetical protein VFP09_09390 [Desertimonas sp.]|nr:hypothetical protein [Desertimonas sp.]